ncbi:MAG: pyrroline-5-carboxylate reductase [Spirochaetaceae bacterium]|nr:pyrroline-5-carboxylate reductase [Spirochaetaceae bacterium]
MNKDFLIGCIGCGMMGGALIKAISQKIGGNKILLSDGDVEKAKQLAFEVGASVASSNDQIIKKCSHVIIAVKPAFFSSVLEQIKDSYNERFNSNEKNELPVIISIMAGFSIEKIIEMSNKAGLSGGLQKIIRLMPNLPATVSEGMIALCVEEKTSAELTEEVTFVKDILSKAGKVEQVPEKLMDAVTAISGSGPAYGFMFIEALADAAVSFGMPRNQAYIYASQTLKGAAQMVLDTGEHPAKLKDAVCSPAGTTIEAVKILEQKSFKSAIIEGAEAAYKKSIELGK